MFMLCNMFIMLSSREEQEIITTNFFVLIRRELFSDPTELSVWVQAKNQNGSAKSEVRTFKTTEICKEDTSHLRNVMPFLSGNFDSRF